MYLSRAAVVFRIRWLLLSSVSEGCCCPPYQRAAVVLRIRFAGERSHVSSGGWGYSGALSSQTDRLLAADVYTAFLRYAVLYLAAHQQDAAGLIEHMRQVGCMHSKALGLAWKECDVQFRHAREPAPALYLWGAMTASF